MVVGMAVVVVIVGVLQKSMRSMKMFHLLPLPINCKLLLLLVVLVVLIVLVVVSVQAVILGLVVVIVIL